MPVTTIKGIQVLFPFTPYDVQKNYMTKVIECLQNGVNGMLESPTGTGKTLSLFCSSLAWLESKKAQFQLQAIHFENSQLSDNLKELHSVVDNTAGTWNPSNMTPRIIYCLRTHSQLSQAAQELKRSDYKSVQSVVLGSRDQLCLHPEVAKLQNHSTKVFMCRAKTNSKSCPYYFNVDEKIATLSDYQQSKVLDIEDLIVLGKKHTCCPYYAARTLKSKCDIVFTPYNYIIDPKTRRAHGINLEGNVVILDEAHNIESACEESMSFQLRSGDLAACISEVTQTMEMIQKLDNEDNSMSENLTPPDFTIHDLSILKVMLCELEEQLDKEIAAISADGASRPGDFMIDMLSRVELTSEKRNLVVELLEKIILYHSMSTSNVWSSKGTGLQKFSDVLEILFSRTSSAMSPDLKNEFSHKYRVYLQTEMPNKMQNSSARSWTTSSIDKKKSWKLDCWCFSPGIGMQDLVSNGTHSIIMTSGTLSPLTPLVSELGVDFPIRLENPHIIGDNQVLVGIVAQGPDGTPLNSSYQNRFNEKYINSLGRTVSNFCRHIPDGVLVFFPSYSVLNDNVSKWEDMGIWKSLSAIKPVFKEPQKKDAFQESISEYYARINDPECSGAAFLAVCRGKVSEGLDFADKNARAVIITGLPYPPSMDPKVKLKMAYLDACAKKTRGLLGQDWYVLQATRAINQAIGRVIRHKEDYGAILLCDNRFCDKRIRSQLSQWIQGRIEVFNTFGPVLKQLSSFFKDIDPKLVLSCQKKNTISQASTSGAFATKTGIPVRSPCVKSTKFPSPAENSSLFEGYMKQKSEKTASPNKTSNQTKRSIFDAFDECEDDTSQAVTIPSSLKKYKDPEIAPSTSKRNNEPKRSRISIIFRRADQLDEASSSTSHNNNSNVQREMWKKYLLEIKSLLGNSNEYSKFCTTVKNFRASKDTDQFAKQIRDIFNHVPNKDLYIQKTAALVNPQERANFLKSCITTIPLIKRTHSPS